MVWRQYEEVRLLRVVDELDWQRGPNGELRFPTGPELRRGTGLTTRDDGSHFRKFMYYTVEKDGAGQHNNEPLGLAIRRVEAAIIAQEASSAALAERSVNVPRSTAACPQQPNTAATIPRDLVEPQQPGHGFAAQATLRNNVRKPRSLLSMH